MATAICKAKKDIRDNLGGGKRASLGNFDPCDGPATARLQVLGLRPDIEDLLEIQPTNLRTVETKADQFERISDFQAAKLPSFWRAWRDSNPQPSDPKF